MRKVIGARKRAWREPAHANRPIAENIQRKRLAKSWLQHDLANESGTRQALISSFEAGDANPSLEALDRIAPALGVRKELVREK
jgi:transcriptional regulator with XRE-family HTH domain